MYEHLDQKQRERLRQLERGTVRTLNDAEKAEYQALIAPRGVEAITPEGQQVPDVYDGKDHIGRKPYAGLIVNYYPRRGEGRWAKTQFPAMVLEDAGIEAGRKRLKLMVIWDAKETQDAICLQRTKEDRYGTWEYIDDPYLNALEARIAQLEAKANGNGRPPPPRPK